jgi:DNA repair ATPase RecN
MDNQEQKRRDNNKIYFLLAVIIALLGTSVYLYLQKNKTEQRIETITDERTAMQTELEKLETDLEKANTTNTRTTEELNTKDEQLRIKIAELKQSLANGKLTHAQLAKAKSELQNLRSMVSQYTTEIEGLQKQNAVLTVERDSLKTTVSSVSRKAQDLSRQNDSLNTRVKVGAALKGAGISAVAYKIRNNGKEIEVEKSSTAKKLKIYFSIPSNPIAEKGMHDVYIRILDPAGNLIPGENGTFESDGQNLQYTYKTAIEYAGEGKSYTIDWINQNPYSPGNYTILLYSDNSAMGKGSFSLR